MKSTLTHRLLSGARLSAADSQALLNAARTLKQAAQTGTPTLLLRGKHIALLCDQADSPGGRVFEQAATQLGARVSRLRVDALLCAEGERAESARMLARLYDMVECERLTPAQARALQAEAGVPVCNGLSRSEHPITSLLAPDADDTDRLYLMQAALMNTIA
ncbi:hypothetical protein [Ideonella sp. BN130291]|uniref:hypothetical protein n=1 Tax=Ideonella sp. BN130291 TaxID=3112940 RepID=UPI002E26CBFA|nr:hypothetical protein [Ideonella sp. BN130291]